MLHSLDALHLLEGGRQENVTIEGRDEYISCLIGDKLRSVCQGGRIDDLIDVHHTRYPRTPQLSLDQAKIPVGLKLGVACQCEVDAELNPSQHSSVLAC